MRTLRRLAEQVRRFSALFQPSRASGTTGATRAFWAAQHRSRSGQSRRRAESGRGRCRRSGISGLQVATLREEHKQIPVVTRLRWKNAPSSPISEPVRLCRAECPESPLLEVAVLQSTLETQRIRRLEHFRTITVKGFPAPGALPSEGLRPAWPRLMAFAKRCRPAIACKLAGSTPSSSRDSRISWWSWRSPSRPFTWPWSSVQERHQALLVFAAVPYGTVGAWPRSTYGTPFGFMAFLGIASLVGVIVSHVIVLFDFIEERHEAGEPLIESLLDAGIARLRPVLITVGATVLALLPLALHGGPLWEPLCYAQIGGLSVATFIELLLVPVLYTVFVLDLKLVTWETKAERSYVGSTEAEA